MDFLFYVLLNLTFPRTKVERSVFLFISLFITVVLVRQPTLLFVKWSVILQRVVICVKQDHASILCTSLQNDKKHFTFNIADCKILGRVFTVFNTEAECMNATTWVYKHRLRSFPLEKKSLLGKWNIFMWHVTKMF